MYANATKGTPIVNSDHGPLHSGVLRYDPRKSPLNFLLADSWTPCAHPHQQAKGAGAGDKKIVHTYRIPTMQPIRHYIQNARNWPSRLSWSGHLQSTQQT